MSFEDLFKGKHIIAADVETTGLNYNGSFEDYGYFPARPFLFTFTTYENKNWHVRFDVDPYTRRVMFEKNTEEYTKLLHVFSQEYTWVFHNMNFDIPIIQRSGIDIKGNFMDTMILSFVDNCSRPTGLKPLCKQLFDITEDDQKDLVLSVNKHRRKGKKLGYKLATKELGFGDKPNLADYWLGDKDLCLKYGLTDTDRTMGLYWALEERYKSDDVYRRLVDIELKVCHVVREMQDRGNKIDMDRCIELRKYYTDITTEQLKIKKDLGYESLNPKSSKQMKEVFYKQLNLPPEYKRRKDKETGESTNTLTTDADTLDKWSKKVPLAKCLIEISAAQTQLNTFIKTFENVSIKTSDGNILKPSYRTVGAVTGRLSCAKPNLMNISAKDSIKRVSETAYRSRECFVPRKGYILTYFDYKQIEVWISAFLSKDPIMVQYLLNGGDLHTKTGEACFGHKHDYQDNRKGYRKKGKTLNFGSIYGMGAGAIMKSVDCEYNEALELFDRFWSTYNGLAMYRDKLVNDISEKCYIENPFGRRYYMKPEISFRALNYITQGSAGEVMKRAMINVSNLLKDIDAHMVLTIYDELCIEVSKKIIFKPFARKVIKAMQSNFHTYFGIPSPLGVDVAYTCTNWADKKDIEI